MARLIELKGTVTEIYPGDARTPHLGGRLRIDGDGFSIEAHPPCDQVAKLKPGQEIRVTIETR